VAIQSPAALDVRSGSPYPAAGHNAVAEPWTATGKNFIGSLRQGSGTR
jgi:hypothetical protein